MSTLLTALRQQVADLRAALEEIAALAPGYGFECTSAYGIARRVLAATQPQEVQP